MTQNDKKLCLSHSVSHFVSHEPYVIWLFFFWYMSKMIISPAIFIFYFFNILFCFVFFCGRGGGVHGDKKCKKSPIIYQFQSIACYISRIVDHIIKIVGTTNKKKTKFKQPVNCSVAEALTAWYKDKAMTSVISWLQAQSFLYENNCKLQVLQKAGIKIAACSIYSHPFFFYIVSLLLENKKLLWLQFSSAN